VSHKYPALHYACWFQMVWDTLDHLGSLSSCGFSILWNDSVLFCPQSQGGTWVVLFCLPNVAL
jgi:hypothetical protein